jgi:hypothetical protein
LVAAGLAGTPCEDWGNWWRMPVTAAFRAWQHASLGVIPVCQKEQTVDPTTMYVGLTELTGAFDVQADSISVLADFPRGFSFADDHGQLGYS